MNYFCFLVFSNIGGYSSLADRGIIKYSLGACTSLALILCFFSSIGYAQDKDYVTVRKSMTLMGSRFDITVVSVDEELGYINIQEAAGEIRRIEKLTVLFTRLDCLNTGRKKSKTVKISKLQPIR